MKSATCVRCGYHWPVPGALVCGECMARALVKAREAYINLASDPALAGVERLEVRVARSTGPALAVAESQINRARRAYRQAREAAGVAFDDQIKEGC